MPIHQRGAIPEKGFISALIRRRVAFRCHASGQNYRPFPGALQTDPSYRDSTTKHCCGAGHGVVCYRHLGYVCGIGGGCRFQGHAGVPSGADWIMVLSPTPAGHLEIRRENRLLWYLGQSGGDLLLFLLRRRTDVQHMHLNLLRRWSWLLSRGKNRHGGYDSETEYFAKHGGILNERAGGVKLVLSPAGSCPGNPPTIQKERHRPKQEQTAPSYGVRNGLVLVIQLGSLSGSV